MALPLVAIVGRPNVGKSSILNFLSQKRISIVDERAGVTRDRVSCIVECDEKYFELVDTGGVGIVDDQDLNDHVDDQITLALGKADVVIFVVDIRSGVMPLDMAVAKLLRDKPFNIILVANKADSFEVEHMVGDLHKLGFGDPLCISAKHSRNRDDINDAILKAIENLDTTQPRHAVMHMAIVGKQNAGKSTFINAIVGEQRVIVSEVPGTTRDAVDVRFEKDGQVFVAIDTAGVRKKKMMVKNDIEFYSHTRALRSVRRADVVLLFIDATLSISAVDKKLARSIADENKPCIIVMNKWDLAMKKNGDTEDFQDYIDKMLPGLSFSPISFITASDGKNVQSLLDLAALLYKQSTTEVSTGRLNKAIELITKERAPSVRHKVGFPKIYYATQVATQPPTILFFVNKADYFDENYQRFLTNKFREMLPFSEVPIRLMFRGHKKKKDS
jgi:GTP-binding protein